MSVNARIKQEINFAQSPISMNGAQTGADTPLSA